MKLLSLCILTILMFNSCDVKKTASAQSTQNTETVNDEVLVREEVAPDFSVQKASYMYHKGGIRTVGNVYSFVLLTHQEDVSIDSVWFGGLPVACDVYDNGTKMGHQGPMVREAEYLVKANKNLYRNFYPTIDSTEVARSFVAPMPFKGEAIIFYKQYGLRKYMVVNEAEYLGKKSYR